MVQSVMEQAAKEDPPVATTTRKPWTADELHRLPPGWRYEIDAGELVIMSPAGYRHGDLVMRIGRVLGNFVDANRLGRVVGGEAGFRLQSTPEILRGADVAFVSAHRDARIKDRKSFSDIPPDLAVEVHDSSEPDLRRKIEQYLAAGVRSVWVIDPESRTLTRHVPGEPPRVWNDPDAVVLEPVVPGFSCRLHELFGEA